MEIDECSTLINNNSDNSGDDDEDGSSDPTFCSKLNFTPNMELLREGKQRCIDLYHQYPKVSVVILGVTVLYGINKIYQIQKYNQKIFTKQEEIENKVILITGCDTGFGNLLALTLATTYGYRVIATCLKQESVDKFLSNSSFTTNGSTSCVMDVTKSDDILRVKELTIKYLFDTGSILWGIVNNAGFAIFGEFEVIPPEFDELERNVLYDAPRNIIRTFLPLLPGIQRVVPVSIDTQHSVQSSLSMISIFYYVL